MINKMKFVQQESSYVVVDSKKEAAKMLGQDRRVSDVKISTIGNIIITTHPIKPVCTNSKYKKIIKHPVGVYIITLYSNLYDYIDIKIKRIGGGIGTDNRDLHPHINLRSSGDKICWGNADLEVKRIKINRDWFWLGKRALDILEDGEPEFGGEGILHLQGLFVRIMIELQVNYLRDKYGDSQQNKKRMKVLYELYDKLYDSTEDA